MVFSSLEFLLLFLPVFLIIYYLSPPRYRNMCLLMASLAFYAYGVRAHIAYLFLLLASVCINFFLGLFIERYHRKSILILGLLYNLGVLFVFKYSGFFFASVLRVATQPFQPELPIGISFYTFQAVSYLIDIYRRATPAEQNLVCFGTYIIMFPQLIAGPIVRYQDIRKRLHRRRCTPRAFLHGLSQFVFGLGLKVILANRIGNLWSSVCGIGFESVSTPLAWMGILACSLQIYFDFWGYSQMAIGLGRMIGFTLPVNFRHPYQARSMTDFWRRWHITLGAWFREYVYIPLGGNREGAWKTWRNLLIVWVLTGVWHGAGWNFLIWGFFLFAVIAIEKAGLLSVLERHPLCSRLYMLLLIPVCWLMFSVTDLSQMGIYFQRLVGLGGTSVFQGDFLKYAQQYGLLLAVGVLFCTPVPYRVWDRVKKPWATVILVIVVLLTCIYYLYMGMNDPFLYFNF